MLARFLFLGYALFSFTFLQAAKFPEGGYKTRVIINPISGGKGKAEIVPFLSTLLFPNKFDLEVFYTEGPHHATELAKEAADNGYDLVIAVGGDGTVNEVGKALVGTKTTLGIIPMGSGDGMARNLNIPQNPMGAIAVINRFIKKKIDTIKVNDQRFFTAAGIGFDADISWGFADSNGRGLIGYLEVVLDGYFDFKPKKVEFVIDDQRQLVEEDGLLVTFANGKQYGNDVYIAPMAKMNDGYVHLVVLKMPPIFALPDILIRLGGQSIGESIYYYSIKAKKIEVKGKNISAHLDGDPYFFEDGMIIEVDPLSLTVLVP